MARIRLKDSWLAPTDLEAAKDALELFFKRTKMQVVEQDRDEWRVKQGSQLRLRLFGGWFISPESLPKRATIVLRSEEDGVLVKAVIEDTLGFGILDPLLESKYEDYSDQ